MGNLGRSGIVLAAALCLGGLMVPVTADAATKKERALRVHEQRTLQRQQMRRQQIVNPPAMEQQRSRPVPPTAPGSFVVPNR